MKKTKGMTKALLEPSLNFALKLRLEIRLKAFLFTHSKPIVAKINWGKIITILIIILIRKKLRIVNKGGINAKTKGNIALDSKYTSLSVARYLLKF
jgi:hypothetical protein